MILETLDMNGDVDDMSTSVTVICICEFSDIRYGYNCSGQLPDIGDAWGLNTDYHLSGAKFSREAKKYFSTWNTAHNGADCVNLELTYSVNYGEDKDGDGEGESAFDLKIAGAGYQTYNINSCGAYWGWWNYDGTYTYGVPINTQDSKYQFKLPISQIDMTTTIAGEINEWFYNALRGKINSTTFLHRSVGTVLYDNYSIIPKFDIDGNVVETKLTLTFKCLPIDWNIEWKNPSYAVDTENGKTLYWQDENPNRQDYCGFLGANQQESLAIANQIRATPIIQGSTTKYNKLVWNGTYGVWEYQPVTEVIGSAYQGHYGWASRYWLLNATFPTTTQDHVETNRKYVYDYADLSELFYPNGHPNNNASSSNSESVGGTSNSETPSNNEEQENE